MAYLTWSDIKDSSIRRIGEAKLSEYFTVTDNEINDLAEQVGITNTDDIETDPLHYKIKRFGYFFFCAEVFRDFALHNDAENVEDKYMAKWEMYQLRADKCRKEITKVMFTGDVSYAVDRANSNIGQMFRG